MDLFKPGNLIEHLPTGVKGEIIKVTDYGFVVAEFPKSTTGLSSAEVRSIPISEFGSTYKILRGDLVKNLPEITNTLETSNIKRESALDFLLKKADKVIIAEALEEDAKIDFWYEFLKVHPELTMTEEQKTELKEKIRESYTDELLSLDQQHKESKELRQQILKGYLEDLLTRINNEYNIALTKYQKVYEELSKEDTAEARQKIKYMLEHETIAEEKGDPRIRIFREDFTRIEEIMIDTINQQGLATIKNKDYTDEVKNYLIGKLTEIFDTIKTLPTIISKIKFIVDSILVLEGEGVKGKGLGMSLTPRLREKWRAQTVKQTLDDLGLEELEEPEFETKQKPTKEKITHKEYADMSEYYKDVLKTFKIPRIKVGSKVYLKSFYTPFVVVDTNPLKVVAEEELKSEGFAEAIPISTEDIEFKKVYNINLEDIIVDKIYGQGEVKDISRMAKEKVVGVKFAVGYYNPDYPLDNFPAQEEKEESEYFIRHCGITDTYCLPSIYCAGTKCEYCQIQGQQILCSFDADKFLREARDKNSKPVQSREEKQPLKMEIIKDKEISDTLLKVSSSDILKPHTAEVSHAFEVSDLVIHASLNKVGKVKVLYPKDNCVGVQWDGSDEIVPVWPIEILKIEERTKGTVYEG